jgi:hypothetical protein
MKIALIKPDMGDIISGYDIADGNMEPLQLAIITGLVKNHDEGRLLYDGHWWNHPDYRYNQATFKPRLISADQLSEATVKAKLYHEGNNNDLNSKSK